MNATSATGTAPGEAFTPEQIPAPEPVYNCPNCSHYIRPGELACPECGRLIYTAHLNRIGAAAQEAEQASHLLEAQALWAQALEWLPADVPQAGQIRRHVEALRQKVDETNESRARWTRRLGPLAPLFFLLLKLKSAFFLLFKLKFLLGFLSFFGLYWALYGWKFAAGFTASILIHEFGHYIAVRARGVKADLPMLLPFMGYVRWYGANVTPPQLASIALAGPFAGLLAACASLGLLATTHQPVFLALAYTGAWINLINLIPISVFDGGMAAVALSRLGRGLLLASCVVLFALMHEGVFLFIGLGALWKLFTGVAPEHNHAPTLVKFLLLLFALGAFLYFVPAPGALAR